jgi:hypothetical protein
MRLHRGERGGEAVHMVVAVVLVVNDADVRGTVLDAEQFADGDHVFRLAAPAAVVVEAELAAGFPRALDGREQLRGGLLDALGLRRARRAGDGHPNLRAKIVLRELLEGLLVRGPEGEVVQAALAVFQNLRLELGDVLLPPVVGDVLEAELRRHLRALGGTTLLGVERHDAPRDEVRAGEDVGRRGGGSGENGARQGEEKQRPQKAFHGW